MTVAGLLILLGTMLLIAASGVGCAAALALVIWAFFEWSIRKGMDS